jgi:glycosyltransferase involved in cell wall biosynthesis/GT2 family glycosyltransferase
MSDAPAVSIVINTLNRATLLASALAALRGLDYPNFEVVVVNGPSTDGTEALLETWAGKVRIARCEEANLSVSRNIGIAHAAGEIVVFIDDDAAPHPKWLSRLAGAFRDPDIGGAGGFTVDNTGVAWQARKTVCDRFGAAYPMSAFFDERTLNHPGLAFYPSLLGTNCAFRASALRQIGGFDHAFAYFLDETDVCLRLIDAGWKLAYEPGALIFHQFAESHIRAADRVPRSLYPTSVSKTYFIQRHGAAQDPAAAGEALGGFRKEILAANAWLQDDGRIDPAHRRRLDRDVLTGIQEGMRLAAQKQSQTRGDLRPAAMPPFHRFETSQGLRIAFVSQGFPPGNESGIPRWTALAAQGLAARGHLVHVLTRSEDDESVVFEDGLWIHRMAPDNEAGPAMAEALGIPESLGGWCARVWREAQSLKTAGVDLVSFPIWDLEGLALMGDPDQPAVVSLHTTYAMAKPFKPEWSARPLLERFHVTPVIAAEGRLLADAPRLLANSQAVVEAIADLYGIDVRSRSLLAPHGVPDPLTRRAAAAARRAAALATGSPLRVLFVGRFEPRKGFDIAAAAAARLLQGSPSAEVWFVGQDLGDPERRVLAAAGLEGWEETGRVRFLGEVDREALDDLYVETDLLIAPSRFESFGLIGIEAMAAGRPVLALDVGGLAEIIELGVTGLAFKEAEQTPDEIVRAVLALDADRERLAAMGRAARARYEAHYSVEAMAEALEAAYRAVLAGRAEAAA